MTEGISGKKDETGNNGGTKTIWKAVLTFADASGMYAVQKQSGQNLDPFSIQTASVSADKSLISEIMDFELIDERGISHSAETEIAGNRAILTCEEEMSAVREVRYCYHSTNKGALLYNQEGFPMTPFRIEITDVC